MVCLKNMCTCGCSAFAALLAGGGLVLGASLPAVAAELDFDAPRHGSIKDYYGDYERDWHLRRSVRHDCVPREFIRDELPADGWRDFRDPRHHGSVVLVEARRER